MEAASLIKRGKKMSVLFTLCMLNAINYSCREDDTDGDNDFIDQQNGRKTTLTRVNNNGNKYEGILKNNKAHGKGKYTFTNGDVYEGEFKNGVIDGIGKITGGKWYCIRGGVDE